MTDRKILCQANLGFEPRFTDSESVVLTAIRIRHVTCPQSNFECSKPYKVNLRAFAKSVPSREMMPR